MHVMEILKERQRAVETIEASEPLMAAVARFVGAKVRALVVVENRRPVGMLTVRDILRCIQEDGSVALENELRAAMSADLVSVTPGTGLEEAAKLFVEHEINHLPVLDGAELVGVVTLADVLGEHLEHTRGLHDDLRRYIHGGYAL